MKTLPAIDVTDGQYARLAAVIPGDTPAEKAEAYQLMVKQMLREKVIEYDIQQANITASAARAAAIEAAYNNPDNLEEPIDPTPLP